MKTPAVAASKPPPVAIKRNQSSGSGRHSEATVTGILLGEVVTAAGDLNQTGSFREPNFAAVLSAATRRNWTPLALCPTLPIYFRRFGDHHHQSKFLAFLVRFHPDRRSNDNDKSININRLPFRIITPNVLVEDRRVNSLTSSDGTQKPNPCDY